MQTDEATDMARLAYVAFMAGNTTVMNYALRKLSKYIEAFNL